MLSYFQAAVMGLLQGVTELFPVSSLGHSVIFPTLFGWTNLVKAQANPESFFLAFLVGLHLATATALLIFYRKEWIRITLGFFSSIRYRRIQSPDERLAWLLITATIPTGALALIFEHFFRTFFSKPLYAALFLMVNGVVLFVGEALSRRSNTAKSVDSSAEVLNSPDLTSTEAHLKQIKFRDAALMGTFQTGALLAGISRSGISLVGGLVCKLNHQDAARFSFLMATPIILLAGLYKIPSDLLGHNGDGIRLQILVGSLVAFVAAYFSVSFLDRYFRNKTSTPYALYSLIAGGVAFVWLLLSRATF